MPLVNLTLAAGTDFDGTTGLGEVLFLFQGVANTKDDTKRAVVYSVAINAAGSLTSLRVRLAPDLASAKSDASFLSVLEGSDIANLQASGCRFVVPRGWNLYAFTTEDSAQEKTLIVDWTRNANREGMF